MKAYPVFEKAHERAAAHVRTAISWSGTARREPEPQRQIITDTLKSELPKLNPEIAAKVRDVWLANERSNT
jgi:hypothetical protein